MLESAKNSDKDKQDGRKKKLEEKEKIKPDGSEEKPK